MKITALLVPVVSLLLLVPRAEAQDVRLQIDNGLVTLDAQNVSVRQILAEWARVGGTKIVNGDKVIGGPVTLRLAATPERQALDTILRGVSGYMLAARQTAGTGSSSFDRILIMPTSSAPRAAGPVPAPNATNAPFAPRPMPAAVQPVPEPVETVAEEDYDEQESGEAESDDAEPMPGNQQFQRPQRFPNPMGPQGQPFAPQVGPGGPPPFVPEDAPPAQPTTSPFNVPAGASTMPGVIAPVPQQDNDEEQPRNRPPSPRRPPL